TVAVALDDREGVSAVLRELAGAGTGKPSRNTLAALTAVFDALDRHGRSLDAIADADTRGRVGKFVERTRAVATDTRAAVADRLAALPLLGRDPARRD